MFVGSEIYQEVLAKALAKNFGAKLMIVDTLLLPGVNFQLAFTFFLSFERVILSIFVSNFYFLIMYREYIGIKLALLDIDSLYFKWVASGNNS